MSKDYIIAVGKNVSSDSQIIVYIRFVECNRVECRLASLLYQHNASSSCAEDHTGSCLSSDRQDNSLYMLLTSQCR